MDIKDLIEAGNKISVGFSPEALRFRERNEERAFATAGSSYYVESGPDEVDRLLAEVSVLSSRQELWEVGISLVGYASMQERAPVDVLNDIPFERYLSEPAESQSDPFLGYCRNLIGLSDRTVFSTAYAIKLTLSSFLLFSSVDWPEILRACTLECGPGDPTCIDDCVRRKASER
jgi:hypothetical protein